MNVTELARKLRVNTKELFELLPQFGFDIGQRAIKIDPRVAQKILKEWPRLYRAYEAKKLAELKQKQIEERKQQMEQSGPIVLPAILTVKEFAEKIGLPINQVIKELMGNGILATLNERIDFDTAAIIAEDLGLKVEKTEAPDELADLSNDDKLKEILAAGDQSNLRPRPPIVVVMGHVDHGKTKLLDAIRQTNVVDKEFGGITQHIGAYQATKNGRAITFIDTPGHEAFTSMRSRGAKVADVAILVVAADDGIKPQTIEAIRIIQAVKIPFVVAINKIDKPEANIEKVKQDLARENLLPEDWGGQVVCVPISAKQRQNIDQLLETILLVADMEKDKMTADYDRLAVGVVIEAHLDRNEGAVGTALVKCGTLQVNDVLSVGGVFYGKVRAMRDWQGKDVTKAPPGMPVKILGWKLPPQVGDIIEIVTETKSLEVRKNKRVAPAEPKAAVSTSQSDEEEDKKSKVLKLILKTDVLGSAEAIVESLEKLEFPEGLNYKVIGRGLGNITETDVLQAEGQDALVLGFNVLVQPIAVEIAKEKHIEVKTFKIIYELLDLVKERLNSMIEVEIREIEMGKVEVLAIFKKVKNNQIIGGKVKNGKIENGAKVRLKRNDLDLERLRVVGLQAGKEEVKDVERGSDCGIRLEGKTELMVGDILEVYSEERIEKRVK
ncbi:MAG: translation initiation factor IF-2 [Patescibacteria group bacterium]